jgi:uncharacterized protein YbcI
LASPAGEGGRGGSVLLQISNAVVRLYKDAFGRGPTKARAQFAGADTLVVVLEDSMTVVERNLAAMGEHRRLREGRAFFSTALEEEFRAIVERALGRRTVAFVSGIDTRHDISIAVFTLEPRPAGRDADPSEQETAGGQGGSEPGRAEESPTPAGHPPT